MSKDKEVNPAILLENFFSNPKFFGGIIKYWRNEKGWSRKKLADEVNMHPSNIQRYEEGKIANIPFSVVTVFANAFNVSIEAFLNKDVIDKVSYMLLEDFAKENDRKKEKIAELKVIENIFKKLGIQYGPDFSINLDKIQKGELNPEFSILYGTFYLNIDLDMLVFIILLLTPNKDPFTERLISYEEASNYFENNVEKKGDDYVMYLRNQFNNFWLLLYAFKYPVYNNNSTSRKRFLIELKAFLRLMKNSRLTQQECIELVDGLKISYFVLNQIPKILRDTANDTDDNEGENYE